VLAPGFGLGFCLLSTAGRAMSTGGYFNGNIADAQTWEGTNLNPTEAATLSGTPGYDLLASDGTALTFGPGGYPNATLELQADGNLVIYGSYGQVLWASKGDLTINGTAYVFWQGTDGNLWEAYYDGAVWVGPYNRDIGTLRGTPAVTVSG
jgi:hypothetical protein